MSKNKLNYFGQLNYTLGNEDTSLEYSLVKSLKPSTVLAVCGSGGRSLPLLIPKAKKLVLADISKPQLALARLRLATYRDLSYNEFLRFWSYAPYSIDDKGDRIKREKLFSKLKLHAEDKKAFDLTFKENDWQSLLYIGRWEKTFALFARIAHILLGDHRDELFSKKTLGDQKKYLQVKFPWPRWRLLITALGNRQVFNALLYKGHFIKKNVSQSYVRYYEEAFNRLFEVAPARESFFLNLCFYGKIQYVEGNPLEAQKSVHSHIKRRLKEKNNSIIYFQGDILKVPGRFDFISLSDVPSYFSGKLEARFLQLLRPKLNFGGVIVIRYYLRVCAVDIEGLEDITDQYEHLIEKEKVQMYIVRIYRLVKLKNNENI